MFGLTVTTPPTEEPLLLSEAKMQLRFSQDYEDQLILSLITASRQFCERWTGKAFITQTLKLTLDRFPDSWSSGYDGPGFYQWGAGSLNGGEIRLPRPPLQTVSSVQYVDQTGVTRTVATSVYATDATPEVGRVFLKFGQIWPTDVLWQAGSVFVNYVAGYGARTAVPDTIKHAMRLLIGHWFENREAVGNVGGAVAMAVESLLGCESAGILAGTYQ